MTTTTTTTISQHHFDGDGDSETSLSISIIENMKEEYGLFVWPCSVILAEYVWQQRSRFRDSTVLELGAGTSLPGLVAAKVGANVTLTDDASKPEVLGNMRRVCELKKLNCNVMGLTWGVWDALVFDLRPNIILGADVLYDSSAFHDLFATVSFLLQSSPDAVFITTYHNRSGHHLLEFLMVKWGLKCVKLLDGFSFLPSHKASVLSGNIQLVEIVVRLKQPDYKGNNQRDNEANMIKKIARDVSDKLNATQSKDFENMVGLEAHLREMESLLDLDNVGVKIVSISGPAGIGKTTIARALQSLLSDRFQLTCFMDLRGSDPSDLHDYGLQLRLQEQLLSMVLNQDGMRICHLGVLQQRLCDLRVLIILDDVNNLKQLEALAKETTWFGPGSRIVVTTENKELLQQHGINNTYHVGFPSDQEAVKILCRYAFRQTSPRHGFKELAARITHLCGNLPLGLSVMGSSLFGKKQDEWECVTQRLETNPGREIDDVLRVSYERLHENDQMLFLHIAVFFNYKDCDIVEAMLADDGNLDVKNWMKVLVNKSLIEINPSGEIVMHKLLQQVGRQAIGRQKLRKRQILIDAHEICDFLRYEKGTSNVFGISFDTSGISEVTISDGAFKRLHDLRFLHVYKSRYDGNNRVHIPEEVEFPPRLRLLQWEAYPSKCLPPTFLELHIRGSQLEKLCFGVILQTFKYEVALHVM